MVVEVCRTIHDECNNVFHGRTHSQVPSSTIVQNVKLKLNVMLESISAGRKHMQIKGYIQELKNIVLMPRRRITLAAQANPKVNSPRIRVDEPTLKMK